MTDAALPFADLMLVDDVLPTDFSPFRTLEYGHYLEFFDAALLTLEDWHLAITNESFDGAVVRLPIAESLKPRIRRFRDAAGMGARLAYVTFLENAARLFPYLETRGLPFILQLYPGGRFNLEQTETDERLRTILHSPLCRKVIVTQTLSQRYVTERIGCDPDKVEFIYGGVFDSRVDFDFFRDKQRFGRDKGTLDLCFVAHRYNNSISAKGYDHFVAVLRHLAAHDPRLRFHVVGDYRPDDLPLGEALDRVTFYGRQPGTFFRTFYPKMDAILSVNRPSSQEPGAFDGFPTGACIEAGFRGVLNCINDPLGMNFAFRHGENIVLLDLEPLHTIATLEALFSDPERLYTLAEANWRAFRDVFNIDRQLWARTQLIAHELMRPEALIIPPPARASRLDGMIDNNVAFWREQVRSHASALSDVERRHQGLIQEYQDVERRHQGLIQEYQGLQARHDQLMTWHASLAEDKARLAQEVATLHAEKTTLITEHARQEAERIAAAEAARQRSLPGRLRACLRLVAPHST